MRRSVQAPDRRATRPHRTRRRRRRIPLQRHHRRSDSGLPQPVSGGRRRFWRSVAALAPTWSSARRATTSLPVGFIPAGARRRRRLPFQRRTAGRSSARSSARCPEESDSSARRSPTIGYDVLVGAPATMRCRHSRRRRGLSLRRRHRRVAARPQEAAPANRTTSSATRSPRSALARSSSARSSTTPAALERRRRLSFSAPASVALLQRFQKAAPAANDDFGRAVASRGGGKVLVGAPLDDTSRSSMPARSTSSRTIRAATASVDAGEQCDDGNLARRRRLRLELHARPAAATASSRPASSATTAISPPVTDAAPTCTTRGRLRRRRRRRRRAVRRRQPRDGDGCDSNCTPTALRQRHRYGRRAVRRRRGERRRRLLLRDLPARRLRRRRYLRSATTSARPSAIRAAQRDGDVFGDACDVCPTTPTTTATATASASATPSIRRRSAVTTRARATWRSRRHGSSRRRCSASSISASRRRKDAHQGSFALGSKTPLLRPQVNGIHLRIIDTNRPIIVDEHVSRAEFPKRRRLEDDRPARRTSGIYHRQDEAFGIHNGIRKMIIKDLSRFAPNRVGLLIKGKGGDYPMIPGNEPHDGDRRAESTPQCRRDRLPARTSAARSRRAGAVGVAELRAHGGRRAMQVDRSVARVQLAASTTSLTIAALAAGDRLAGTRVAIAGIPCRRRGVRAFQPRVILLWPPDARAQPAGDDS